MQAQNTNRFILNGSYAPRPQARPALPSPAKKTKTIVLAVVLFVVTAANTVLACRSLFPAPCRPTIMSAANDPQEVAYMRGTAPMEAGAFPAVRYTEAVPALDRQTGGK